MWRLALVILAACQDSPVSRSLGARCDGNDECADRCLAESDGFPGGFCTIDCDGPGDCGERGACVNLEGGVCLFTCVDLTDCDFLGGKDVYECLGTPAKQSGPPQFVTVCRTR